MMNTRLMSALLLIWMLCAGSSALAVTQTTGAMVSATPTVTQVPCAVMAYTVQESIVTPIVSGVASTVNSLDLAPGVNFGAFLFSTAAFRGLQYVTTIPFATVPLTVNLTSVMTTVSVNDIAVDRNTGIVYVAWAVPAANPLCATPTGPSCLGIIRINRGIIELSNSNVVNRLNAVYTMTQDDSYLYVRTDGIGVLGNEASPAIIRVDKGTFAPTPLQLRSDVGSGGAPPGRPSITGTSLYTTSGLATGHLLLVNTASMTVTLDVAAGYADSTLQNIRAVDGRVYDTRNDIGTITARNATTFAVLTSLTVGGYVARTNSMHGDAVNQSIHLQSNGNTGGTGLTRTTIPVLAAQNTLAAFDTAPGASDVSLQRIIQLSSTATGLRAVKTCTTGL